MSKKVEVKNLVKIFGSKPRLALRRLEEGWSKDKILKATGQTVGVNNASLSVDEGEFFVIMGLSGSGKSTLIRCLNLLNVPTSGEIIVDGKNIVEFDKKQLREFRQKKVAMVFQNFGLFTHRTVLGNVEYGLEIRNIDKAERQQIALDALESVGLKGWEDKKPTELSGGMQQRVGLARALANDPDILLMDEPFGALDPLIRRDMQIELLEIQSKLKKTIIFITHDINEAFKLGDRVAVMKDGKIVQQGTPEDILNNPSDEYIEDFVKSIDRTKVIQAKNIMIKPHALVSIKDGVRVAIREMQANNISSVFVVDGKMKIEGIVTIDDCVEAVKHKQTSLKELLRHDYYKTTEDEYIENILEDATKSKYPIIVVNDEDRLLGIIVRTSILTGLLPNESDTEIESA